MVITSGKEEFFDLAISQIRNAANFSIKDKNKFNIVLSGGDTPKPLYSRLRKLDTYWYSWEIWFSDERCTTGNGSLLNCSMANNAFLNHVSVQSEKIHRIQSELGPEKAASLYNNEIRCVPVFDFVLLGLGEDGHTASLFPGSELGNDIDSPDVLAVTRAPKEPSHRVTLSVQRLNRTREVLFLVAGQKKKSAVEAYQRGENMPATLIQGQDKTTLLYCPDDIT